MLHACISQPHTREMRYTNWRHMKTHMYVHTQLLLPMQMVITASPCRNRTTACTCILYTCVSAWKCICIYIYLPICLHVYVCIYIYVYVYVYVGHALCGPPALWGGVGPPSLSFCGVVVGFWGFGSSLSFFLLPSLSFTVFFPPSFTVLGLGLKVKMYQASSRPGLRQGLGVGR